MEKPVPSGPGIVGSEMEDSQSAVRARHLPSWCGFRTVMKKLRERSREARKQGRNMQGPIVKERPIGTIDGLQNRSEANR